MAGIIFGVFCLISFICACISGNPAACGDALFTGASRAVELMLTLGGAMCLWCGLLEVFRASGAIGALEKLLSPLLGLLFPAAKRTGRGMEEIAASLSANLLGIGNAATPLGLRAMEVLEQAADNDADAPAQTHGNGRHGTLIDDMTMFTVLNTAPPALLPTTLLSLRHAAGSENPTVILPAVWAVSVLGFLFAAVVTRALCRCSAASAFRSPLRRNTASAAGAHRRGTDRCGNGRKKPS
ncbi:MAG: spore maturation protein A [Eubacteriales bacterium]